MLAWSGDNQVTAAQLGTYSTTVTGVTAEGLTWYEETPPNDFAL